MCHFYFEENVQIGYIRQAGRQTVNDIQGHKGPSSARNNLSKTISSASREDQEVLKEENHYISSTLLLTLMFGSEMWKIAQGKVKI